jgi:hypothetical protein
LVAHNCRNQAWLLKFLKKSFSTATGDFTNCCRDYAHETMKLDLQATRFGGLPSFSVERSPTC